MGREEAGRPDRAIESPIAAVKGVNPGARERLRQRALRLEYLTIGWNVVEAVVALAAGEVASSIALVGFGLDSIIEVAAGVTVLWRFQQRRLEEGKAESRAAKIVGLTFFALAAYVGYTALGNLWLRQRPRFSLPGLILAALSLAAMPALGIAKRRVAAALQSRALAADALETLFCAYLSGALLMGLALNGILGWWWADPIAGLLMAAFMVREGIEVFSPGRHPN